MSADFQLAEYVVAFLDLMGQKDKILKLEKMPENQGEYDAAISILKETLGVTLDVRDKFREHLERHRRFDLEDRTHLPEDVRARARFELKTFELDFSDSFVIAVPLDDPTVPDQALTAVRMLVASVAAMMLDAHSLARPLRAGVDLGVGVILENGELYGPALVRPYHLESHEADYPRALVGKALLDRLSLIESISPTTHEERVAQVHAVKILRMVATDTDGRKIVDYLGPSFAPVQGSSVNRKHIKNALAFAATARDRFQRLNCKRLGDRYSRLVAYIESRMEFWTDHRHC